MEAQTSATTFGTMIYTATLEDVGNSSTSTVESRDAAGWAWGMVWSWNDLLQLLLAVVGIVGNLLVVLVLAGRNASKYSTDIFIGALAVADFLTSIFMIPIPNAYWVPDTPLGSFYCKFVYRPGYPLWVFVFASAYILAGMSVERFVAVAYPLRRHQLITKRRVYIFLTCVGFFSLPASAHNLTVEVIDNKCKDTKSRMVKVKISIYLFVARVGIPVMIMAVSQVLTALSLNRQYRELQTILATKKADAPSAHVTARNTIVKMTAVIVIIFILSLGPHNLTLMVTGLTGRISDYLFSPLHYAFTFLAFINASANPFIYAARYPKFRKAIKDVFTKGLSKAKLPLFDHGIDHQYSNDTQTKNITSVMDLSQVP
ncbi:galanin receptor 2b-like [Diadema antillarum]|uniref:galanin receptor 2b-like n=1 Tax=Diadema antillarum TaxID=105358 RepID=UPI003A8AE3E0